VSGIAVTKIAALFSFASTLAIWAAITVGIRSGAQARANRIDFGSARQLLDLNASSAVLWIEALALAAPVLALGAGYGWYELLKSTGPLVAYGVLLWYCGMIFVIANDILELALVARLPPAFAASAEHERGALLALGSSMGLTVELLALTGGLVSFFGAALVSIAMLQSSRVPAWIGWLGLVASLLTLLAAPFRLRAPQDSSLGIARLLGYNLFMLWIIATGVAMWLA
jgi:hypothetical protein